MAAKILVITVIVIFIFLVGCPAPPPEVTPTIEAPPPEVPEPITPTEQILAQGTFRQLAKAPTAGSFEIRAVDDRLMLELGLDFVTQLTPDIRIYLATESNWTPDALEVAKLDKASGPLAFELPKGTNLSAYDRVLVYCNFCALAFGEAKYR